MDEEQKHFDEELDELLKRIWALKEKARANLKLKSPDKINARGRKNNKN